VNEGIYKTFIAHHHPQSWKTLAAWKKRRTELLGEMQDQVFRAFPRTKVPFDAWKGVDRGWVSRYADVSNLEFTTEEGIRVSGQLFVPRRARNSHPALIYVKRSEDIVYPVDQDLLLSTLASHVVLVLQPRAVDYPADNYKMATLKRTAALVGATIESMQLWDILRSVDYLIEGEKLKLSLISVYGRGYMGALALYAAAFDDRIIRVILDDPPSSHWQGPALLNILKLTDLPEVAGLVAPRQIVSLTSLPEPYRYTSSIFALYGKQAQILERQTLGDALRVPER
jgi:hypothetical protein